MNNEDPYRSIIEVRGQKLSVGDVLREAIRQGLLSPGMALIQKSLADALGVSRIPVREALQNLAAEGLVVFTSDGARVTMLSADEIDELYSLRLMIEPAMAPAIVRNYAPSDFAKLGDCVQEMDEAVEHLERWADANYKFHEAMYRASGRHHHFRLARQLLTLVEPYSRVAVFHLGGREESQIEHHEMLAALSDQDHERLEQLLVRHLSRAHDDLMRYARRTDDEPRDFDVASAAARAFAARLVGEHGARERHESLG